MVRPTMPTDVKEVVKAPTAFLLVWQPSADNVSVVQYKLYVGRVLVGTTPLPKVALTGLRCNETYRLSVVASDAAGNLSDPALALPRTAPCPASVPAAAPAATREGAPPPKPKSPPAATPAPAAPPVAAAQTRPADVPRPLTRAESRRRRHRHGRPLTHGRPPTHQPPKTPRPPKSPKPPVPPPPPPGQPSGHASAVFLAPHGSNTAACTPTAPCASFDYAYHMAAPGAVVQLAAGTYPAQAIRADPSKNGAASRVVFMPAPGAAVTVAGSVAVQGSHIEVANIAATNWSVTGTASSPATDVVMRNMTVSTFGIFGATNVQVLGGSVGPAVDTSSNVANCYQCPYSSSNIVISGVSFHDYTRTAGTVHMECLHVWPATQLRLVGNTFRNCAVMDVLLSNYGNGADLNGITLENNVFDQPGSLAGGLSAGYYPVLFGPKAGSISNVLIDFNSFLGSMDFNPGVYSNIRIDSNVGPMSQYFCNVAGAGFTYTYNVWSNAACGPTDQQAPTGFVNPQALDLSLLPGAAAIDHGNPNSFPATDVRGRARPVGAGPDAGAYEG
jgi:hypothetical protein